MPNSLTLRVGLQRCRLGLALCALAFAAPALTPTSAAQTGTLAGTVVDADFGDPLIGVNVVVEDLGTTGAATDLGRALPDPRRARWHLHARILSCRLPDAARHGRRRGRRRGDDDRPPDGRRPPTARRRDGRGPRDPQQRRGAAGAAGEGPRFAGHDLGREHRPERFLRRRATPSRKCLARASSAASTCTCAASATGT